MLKKRDNKSFKRYILANEMQELCLTNNISCFNFVIIFSLMSLPGFRNLGFLYVSDIAIVNCSLLSIESLYPTK